MAAPLRISLIGLLSSTVALTGCGVPITGPWDDPAKQIVADPATYSSERMKVGNLSRSVREKLPQPGTEALGFKTLKVSASLHTEGAEGKSTDSEVESTYINDQDDGFVRGITHQTRNGLPYFFSLDLTYRGLAPFIEQSGMTTALRLPGLERAREIKEWPADVRNVPEHGTFTFEWESMYYFGSSLQMSRRVTCTSGDNYPASRFMPQVPGQAVDMTCASFNKNGIETRREKLVYLRTYGIALTVELTQASAKSTVQYKTLVAE